MARNIDPACRQCRREGIKLMLKGLRCETAKCPMERQGRNQPPGMHAFRRGKISDYGIHLREKQKVKRYYGVLEKQFIKYFKIAEHDKANTGEALLTILESRLDNVVYKLGMADSRKAARMVISHGHVRVNGRKVDVPSYMCKVGDVISVKPAERSQKMIKEILEDEASGVTRQAWLEVDAQKMEGRVVAKPGRDDVMIPVEEQLIVELCSR